MSEIPKLQELLELSVEERLAIADAIWDSLMATPDKVPVPGWHREIVEERLAQDAADTASLEEWTEVRRRIEGDV